MSVQEAAGLCLLLSQGGCCLALALSCCPLFSPDGGSPAGAPLRGTGEQAWLVLGLELLGSAACVSVSHPVLLSVSEVWCFHVGCGSSARIYILNEAEL